MTMLVSTWPLIISGRVRHLAAGKRGVASHAVGGVLSLSFHFSVTHEIPQARLTSLSSTFRRILTSWARVH